MIWDLMVGDWIRGIVWLGIGLQGMDTQRLNDWGLKTLGVDK